MNSEAMVRWWRMMRIMSTCICCAMSSCAARLCALSSRPFTCQQQSTLSRGMYFDRPHYVLHNHSPMAASPPPRSNSWRARYVQNANKQEAFGKGLGVNAACCLVCICISGLKDSIFCRSGRVYYVHMIFNTQYNQRALAQILSNTLYVTKYAPGSSSSFGAGGVRAGRMHEVETTLSATCFLLTFFLLSRMQFALVHEHTLKFHTGVFLTKEIKIKYSKVSNFTLFCKESNKRINS